MFQNARWKRPATFYKRLSTDRIKRNRGGNTATSSVVELIRDGRQIKYKSRLQIFVESIYALNRTEEIAFKLSTKRKTVKLFDLMRTSEAQKISLSSQIDHNVEPGRLINGNFYQLSSGEIRLLKLFAQACIYIENGSLLLIDEPETHLHPNFIARLMSALEKLLANTGSCAIMATHSVYVVREVFHDQVIIVEKNATGQIFIKRPGMRTFGADISTISSFIFGEEGISFLAEDTIQRIKNEGLSFEQIREKYGQLLSREILSELRAK